MDTKLHNKSQCYNNPIAISNLLTEKLGGKPIAYLLKKMTQETKAKFTLFSDNKVFSQIKQKLHVAGYFNINHFSSKQKSVEEIFKPCETILDKNSQKSIKKMQKFLVTLEER
jgi:hypothetical protein